MHSEQIGPHNHITLCKVPPPTPSHEIIRAYLTQITPRHPPGGSNQKQKYLRLKI